MPTPSPAEALPAAGAPGGIAHLYRGWASPRDFDDLLDLLEAIVRCGYRRPALWANLSAEHFLAGVGEDPMNVRSRPWSRRVLDAHTLAANLVRRHAQRVLAEHVGSPDLLGPVYASLIGCEALPQFSRPFGENLAIARATVGNIHEQLVHRVDTAVLAAGLPPRGGGVEDAQGVNAYVDTHASALLAHLEPITILDPACGSGALLLAMARLVPLWAFAYRAIRLTGIDLDPRAVQMTRVNCLLYGVPVETAYGNLLNTTAESAIAAPYGSTYGAIRWALANGVPVEARLLAEGLVGYAPEFMTLAGTK